MPAQGNALGTGSSGKNSHALKGHNKCMDKSLVSPFQGWVDSHSHQIPRALPWAFLFGPYGHQKSATPKQSRMSTGMSCLLLNV